MAKKASSRKTVAGKGKSAVAVKKRSGETGGESAKKAVKQVAGKAGAKPVKQTIRAAARKIAAGATKTSARIAAGPTGARAAVAATVAPAKKRKPPKSPLTKAQLAKFRQMLLEKRRELVGDMTGIQAEALGADRQEVKGDISDHPADAGTDNFEQEFSLELLESERLLLAEIDEALGRIEDRTYGICQGTGQPIAKARLKARPWAKHSIEYARMIEKGLVRPGEGLEEDE